MWLKRNKSTLLLVPMCWYMLSIYVRMHINKKSLLLPADGGNKGCPWERSNWKTIWDTGWMTSLQKNSWKKNKKQLMASIDEFSGCQCFPQITVFIPWKPTAIVCESWVVSFGKYAWTKHSLGNRIIFWIPAFCQEGQGEY